MKKFNLTMIPLLCAAAAPLCADAQGTQKNEKTEQQQQQMYQQQMNQITPTAEPAVTRWADPYVTADFIWWRAEESGLEYASTGIGDGISDASKGRMYRPHFEYEPGFKVGLGFKFRHDGWDLYGQYTWLHSRNQTSHAHSRTGSAVMSNIFIPNVDSLDTFTATSSSGKWSMKFNVLDLELGRNFWISKWLTLRPHAGMKFSWINQDYTVHYNGAVDPNLRFDTYRSKMGLDQSAIGLRMGLDTAWYMWKKWCIFGELAVSGMWNDFDSSRKDTAYVAATGLPVKLNRMDRDVHTVTPVLEWALGLRFETSFHKDDYDFMIQAGWEEQVWFSQNQFIMMPNQTPADLTFEGLTIKAAFYF